MLARQPRRRPDRIGTGPQRRRPAVRTPPRPAPPPGLPRLGRSHRLRLKPLRGQTLIRVTTNRSRSAPASRAGATTRRPIRLLCCPFAQLALQADRKTCPGTTRDVKAA